MCVQYSPAVSTDRGDRHRPAQRQVRRGWEGVTDRELGNLELPRSHCSHQRLFSEDIEVRIRWRGGGKTTVLCANCCFQSSLDPQDEDYANTTCAYSVFSEGKLSSRAFQAYYCLSKLRPYLTTDGFIEISYCWALKSTQKVTTEVCLYLILDSFNLQCLVCRIGSPI